MNNIQSYLASYNDSDEDENQIVHDDISDDEQDNLFHGKSKKSTTTKNVFSEEASPKLTKRVTATRLVSYGEDEDNNEKSLNRSSFSEQEEHEHDDDDVDMAEGNKNMILNILDQRVVSPSLSNGNSPQVGHKPYCAKHTIQLPPEPLGNCSKRLQNKVIELYSKVAKEGMNLNTNIQRKKNFRNPSIYERLIEFCGIDEKGTNYPPELYNPTIWGPESHYEELAKAQKIEMDKKEKEKKDKKLVEKVQVTKKSNSKWDDVTVTAPSIQIPAVGPLTKSKPL